MAATGKTPILLYGSTTPTNAPVASNLINNSDGCEIAVNVADGKLFYKDNTNVVSQFGITFGSTAATLGSTVSAINAVTLGQSTPAAGTFTTFKSTSSSDNTAIVESTGTNNAAALLLRSGNGTTSGLYSYTRYVNNNTAGQDWRTGIYGDSDYQIYNSTGSKLLIRCGTGGDVTVGTGNLVIGTSGKGIDFSATAGTGTSELLADYEEGTFTPVITYSGSNGDLSYSQQYGQYTKIGNCVTFDIRLLFGETTASGYISTITGLPFTCKNTTYPGGGAYCDNMTGLTGSGIWTIGTNSTTMYLYFSGTGSATVIYNTNTGASNNAIVISGVYYTS